MFCKVKIPFEFLVGAPAIWRFPPDQQMSIILAQKPVLQVQKYSNFVLVA
jgi:hypothetical protein